MDRNVVNVSHQTKSLFGTVELTGSKSESNRALIIQALSGGKVGVNNLSSAADTVTLQRALDAALAIGSADGAGNETEIDIGPAGTAMRFLAAYLTTVNGKFLLTGSA